MTPLTIMIQSSLDTIGPTLQAMPLALIFTSRLLLAEKVSIPDDGCPWSTKVQDFTVRATLVTPILKGIQGYRHGGIND
jgi:hypothetical protein